MTLDDKLYEAINRMNGFEMIDLLKEAAATGMLRKEAEQTLERLCYRLNAEGRQKEEDLATEILMIAQNFCREEYRIWPLD